MSNSVVNFTTEAIPKQLVILQRDCFCLTRVPRVREIESSNTKPAKSYTKQQKIYIEK